MKEDNIAEGINRLRKEKNAIILAHNYQRPEVQDIADLTGDSLVLAREATRTDADIILLCGVDFMAEVAAILNPEKLVLIPDVNSLCSMAQRLSLGALLEARDVHPEADVVLYINTLAEAKAYADCICTSANAPNIISKMRAGTVLFGPDRNLAYFARKNSGKEVIVVPENGLCPIHHMMGFADLQDARKRHPTAEVVVHPECIPEVQDNANHIASTEGMVRYCKNSSAEEFIIGTENGMLHRLRKEIPEKRFYPLSEYAVCPDMKMHTLQKILSSLEEEKYPVRVPEEIASRAQRAIERMLEG